MISQKIALRVIMKLQESIDRLRANTPGFDEQLDYAQSQLDKLRMVAEIYDPLPEIAERIIVMTPAYADVVMEVHDELTAKVEDRIDQLHTNPLHLKALKLLRGDDTESLI